MTSYFKQVGQSEILDLGSLDLTHLERWWYQPSMPGLSTPISAAAKRDRSVFSRIASGDPEALKTLYNQTSSRAMAIVVRILRNSAEAEEVVQEVYLQIWNNAGRYDAKRGSAAAWVSTISRTRAIDRLRSKGTADRTARAAAQEMGSAPNHPPTPLEEASARHDRERIRRALEQLPTEQHEVLELAYFNGLTQPEISEQTGQPLGTVKSRVRLGMERLSQLLDNTISENS